MANTTDTINLTSKAEEISNLKNLISKFLIDLKNEDLGLVLKCLTEGSDRVLNPETHFDDNWIMDNTSLYRHLAQVVFEDKDDYIDMLQGNEAQVKVLLGSYKERGEKGLILVLDSPFSEYTSSDLTNWGFQSKTAFYNGPKVSAVSSEYAVLHPNNRSYKPKAIDYAVDYILQKNAVLVISRLNEHFSSMPENIERNPGYKPHGITLYEELRRRSKKIKFIGISDTPAQDKYWQTFEIPHEPSNNLLGALKRELKIKYRSAR